MHRRAKRKSGRKTGKYSDSCKWNQYTDTPSPNFLILSIQIGSGWTHVQPPALNIECEAVHGKFFCSIYNLQAVHRGATVDVRKARLNRTSQEGNPHLVHGPAAPLVASGNPWSHELCGNLAHVRIMVDVIEVRILQRLWLLRQRALSRFAARCFAFQRRDRPVMFRFPSPLEPGGCKVTKKTKQCPGNPKLPLAIPYNQHNM